MKKLRENNHENIRICPMVQSIMHLFPFTLQVATVFEVPGVLPIWSRQTGVVVPSVHNEDTPHKHTPLTQRFDKVSDEAQAVPVPHLHVPASQVSVVPLHNGLQSAGKKME